MKNPFVSLVYVLGTITACALFFWFGGTIAAGAEAGLDTAKIESITAKWAIEKADDAPSKPNVLKQSGEATFPVCIKDDTKLKDGFVEVKFKPVAGKKDQTGRRGPAL
jgi:hypothetical protein